MIRTLAALALLTASTHGIAAPGLEGQSAALSSTAPWWEKVTVTIAGDGKARACRYETSLDPAAAKECDVTGNQTAMGDGSRNKSDVTRITFERRFSPVDDAPASAELRRATPCSAGR